MLIEEKRQQMIELALTYGFTAKETVQCSQELDELLNIQLKQTLASQQNTIAPLKLGISLPE
ncbi:aspartyl-phosphate phosphatase Spo0E family protein [Anoxybacteroides tepidamans]|uniref:aspartyl-phosphate phosphatase Spo0E family protein n=1 Tax=Anoxybacteroides tepidamans TaxID=265948 RepID=UPI0022B33B21|nr:aspartyl-phosphate phosphatase Spo0E family protein [Anoxybacillus tepidamans]